MWSDRKARYVTVCDTCKKPIYKSDDYKSLSVQFEGGKIKTYKRCMVCYNKTKVNIVT